MKRRKIRIGRVILAIGIYFTIGIIPIKLANVSVNRAKSEYAMELLAENRNYNTEVRDILRKASEDPNYAGKQIHVWDPDGRGCCSYDTYIGGGSKWHEDGYIICGRGEEVGKVILNNRSFDEFLSIIAALWFIGIPLLFLFAFAAEAEPDDIPENSIQ